MASITTFFSGLQGGGGGVSGTATNIAFFGGTPGSPSTTLDDDSSLMWDDNQGRLAVGTVGTIGSTLTVAGTGASDATSALEIRTSSLYADLLLFRVYDNGRIDSRMLNSSEALTDNLAIGFDAGSSLTTAINSTFLGYEAGKSCTSGWINTVVGANSGVSITEGGANTVLGASACVNLTYGSSNTAVGVGSLYALSGSQLNDSASYNTAIGQNSGRYRGSGSNTNTNSKYGIYIGYASRANDTGNTENETVIGNSLVGNGTNTVTIGNSSVTDTYLRGNMHLEGSPIVYFDTVTGTKIGSTASEKLAFYGDTPNVQPDTLITGAPVVHVGGASVGASDTFGGYTIAQIAAALIRLGLLA
jgi:hypothetical protein